MGSQRLEEGGRVVPSPLVSLPASSKLLVCSDFCGHLPLRRLRQLCVSPHSLVSCSAGTRSTVEASSSEQ